MTEGTCLLRSEAKEDRKQKKQKKISTETTMTLPPLPLALRFVVVVAAVVVFCIIPVVLTGCYPSSSSSFLRPLFLSISPISLSTATITATATTITTTDSSPSTSTTAAARFGVNTNGDKNSHQDLGVEDEDDDSIPQVLLITGATGRLGSKLYFELQEKMKKQQQQQYQNQQHHNPIVEVRALVRNITKAREVLQCTHCDASEGIYLGDVTDSTREGGLMTATQDGKVTTVLIAAAAGIATSPTMIKAIEFDGVVNSVRAVAMNAKSSFLPNVVLCSSMGTTQLPDTNGSGSGGHGGGDVFQAILHWKLNAEAFLSSSGIPSSIVKPCGLDDRLDHQNYTLFSGHFDQPSSNHGVTRTNVARVMTEAAGMIMRNRNNNNVPHHRFDLCSKPGPPITDYEKLIQDSRWEWEK